MDNFHDLCVEFAPLCSTFVLQPVRCFIPMKFGDGAGTLLICVCIAVIHKKREVRIRTRIDAYGSDALPLRAQKRGDQRDNGTCPDEQWQGVNRCRDSNCLSTFDSL